MLLCSSRSPVVEAVPREQESEGTHCRVRNERVEPAFRRQENRRPDALGVALEGLPKIREPHADHQGPLAVATGEGRAYNKPEGEVDQGPEIKEGMPRDDGPEPLLHAFSLPQ